MPRAKPKTTKIYQLKITLLDSEPPIWRRILVPSDIDLEKLHAAVQIAMGWEDCHLHEFHLRDRHIGSLHQQEDAPHLEDERKVHLDQLVREKQKVAYEYDFGDSWGHELLVEMVLDLDPKLKYPLCTGGARACPPEDCGGVGGYSLAG